MKFEEIKAFLESEEGKSPEVAAYLQELNPLSVASVQAFIEKSSEGKSWADSVKDKHLQKGLETWKTNNLEILLNDEIKKRFPEKDEKELEVEKLRAEIEKMKHEKQKEVLTNKAIKIANEKSLPIELVDFFIGNDEDSTISNVNVLDGVFSQYIQKAVEQRLKGDGYVPPKEIDGKHGNLESLSMEDYIKARSK